MILAVVKTQCLRKCKQAIIKNTDNKDKEATAKKNPQAMVKQLIKNLTKTTWVTAPHSETQNPGHL